MEFVPGYQHSKQVTNLRMLTAQFLRIKLLELLELLKGVVRIKGVDRNLRVVRF